MPNVNNAVSLFVDPLSRLLTTVVSVAVGAATVAGIDCVDRISCLTTEAILLVIMRLLAKRGYSVVRSQKPTKDGIVIVERLIGDLAMKQEVFGYHPFPVEADIRNRARKSVS
jgi:hypothetical protein